MGHSADHCQKSWHCGVLWEAVIHSYHLKPKPQIDLDKLENMKCKFMIIIADKDLDFLPEVKRNL